MAHFPIGRIGAGITHAATEEISAIIHPTNMTSQDCPIWSRSVSFRREPTPPRLHAYIRTRELADIIIDCVTSPFLTWKTRREPGSTSSDHTQLNTGHATNRGQKEQHTERCAKIADNISL
ncbi:hypothetical protein FPSE_10142 [Fusarium pseudograminearum CS3096]|uniref:Uncharacterized protein n=1 Tax=Fusarium pseudograminearum (strain CS3096) TaxID=1028729 RepID=K3VBP0_FUSPC|nr:hypothetical protein FPSE_10142 [Fusarium pseudograminearum CS3096]EKJ69728.1 hypothetical protein FPSE_10142 [Fusarium pseudograminearum CS3096]